MPATTILVLAAIVAAFAVLALTLVWAEYQTRRVGLQPIATAARRRPF